MSGGTFKYPSVRRDEDFEEVYHGVTVKDPYRWLEDPESSETQAFVESQNNLTVPFIESCPIREKIRKRLTDLWNFPKYSCPTRHGDRYYFYKNDGLQNQSVIYTQKRIEDEGVVFFDPNKLSEDGTVSVSASHFTEDGSIWVYGLSKSGSDWMTLHFKNAINGEEYSDVLEKVKFTVPQWTHDNKGIFYSRYPDQEGKTDGSETTSNENQKLYYHRLGTKQSEDTLMVEFPDNPKWMVGGEVSDCGNYLIVTAQQECRENLLFIADLREPIKNGLTQKLELLPIVTKYEADYSYVSNDGNVMLIRTNKNAPNYRLIKIDLSSPQEENWVTLVAEDSKNVLDWAAVVNNDKLITCYIKDVKNVLQLHRLGDGGFEYEFPLEMGTIVNFSGKRTHDEMFFKFSSYLTPGRIYRVDFSLPSPWAAQVVREISLPGFDPNSFQTSQVFYESKDGTKVPMFIVSKKGTKLDGSSACLLYGYGGFNVSNQPNFSVTRLLYMLHFNAISVEANIRGGGEYGKNWHNGGRIHNKQNCFDDFAAAAEYLIENKYTSPQKLAIQGGSNGGLLVGACVNQRPDLFGAGIAQVGVFDMLRFHKFTIGYAWSSDYGSSENEDEFKTLLKYSPLHNVKHPQNAPQYPALLLLTADHDDRVVPCHSYKFISEIQHRVGGLKTQTNPLMIRIDTKAGHGAGKPTAKVIEEYTDIICFLVQTLGLEADGI